jgi:hypothetical protein
MPKILGAAIILYFRDITTTVGVPIMVLTNHDHGEVDVHIRKDWQPVLAYDENADIVLLQSLVHDNLPSFKQLKSWLTSLTEAENCIRVEQLTGTDPLLDQKLADAMRGLDAAARFRDR